MLPGIKEDPKFRLPNHFLYLKMERHFVDKYVMNNGFYFQKYQYLKLNTPIVEHIKRKENHITELIP